jgi:acyl-CoA thioesterase-2
VTTEKRARGEEGGGGGLVERLHLEVHPDGGWTARPQRNDRHIFGGLLMSQALRAASFTVPDDRGPHSVHGNFLQGGDGRVGLRFDVETTRDGAAFSSRRVVVTQDGSPLFIATVSFHIPEPGLDYEIPAVGPIPAPESLPVGRYDGRWFESRDVPVDAVPAARPGIHVRRAWFRARRPVPDDPGLHAQGLVYLTDHGATRAVRQPHADHPRVEQRMSVSLDHTVWIHGPARVDEWLLTEFGAVATGAGRGLTFGSVRTADGHLVASIAQEALFSLPDA